MKYNKYKNDEISKACLLTIQNLLLNKLNSVEDSLFISAKEMEIDRVYLWATSVNEKVSEVQILQRRKEILKELQL